MPRSPEDIHKKILGKKGERAAAEYLKKRGLDFSISKTALLKLQDYDWPGNIRELENCLAKAVRNCKKNVIGPELIHFFEQDLQFW